MTGKPRTASAFALLAISPLVFASAAQAIRLPLDATYGRGAGCEIVEAHGSAAIRRAGGTEGFPESSDRWNEDMVATPAYLAGFDWICEAGTIDRNHAALLCRTDGATWLPMPIAKFELSGKSMVLTMQGDPPVTLDRCRL